MLQAEQLLQERYYLEQSLGQNAGRQTWLAQERSQTSPKQVIVKLLAFSPLMQWDEFKLFEREAQVLKTLDHPRLPKYRDYFSLDRHTGEGLCWFALVQDYIPGNSLQQLLDQGKRFTQEQVLSIATQVLDILMYLHELNPLVLHRDIKPSNLILGQDEQVYLVDFGAVQDPTALEGTTFTVVGTAGYAPLEQFYGKAVPASDLYALGATLIHLLTGTAPIDLPQSNLRIQFRHHVSLNPSFLRWLEFLSEPDLDRRFSSASQALDALKTGRSLASSPLTSRQPAGTCITLKKSLNQLVIKVPRPRLSSRKILEFAGEFILLVGSRVFLFLPSILGIGIILFIAYGILSEQLSAWVLVIPLVLVPLMKWFWKQNKEELVRGLADWQTVTEQCFGIHSIVFYRSRFLIEPPLRFSFGSDRYQANHVSDIQNIEVVPSEGVVIETRKHRYVLSQKLTEPEREWLVQEIQDWLLAR
ncbi:MAG TPA: serine/threonine-protein kinase [Coleofasciculaceae cyanobacterium]|jgi:serine/threonine protein kinase